MNKAEWDANGYPTEKTLETIRAWDACDFAGLAEFVCVGWNEFGTFMMMTDSLRLGTGGWSGNEDIITAMSQNVAWWALHWWGSTRGGSHEFRRGES